MFTALINKLRMKLTWNINKIKIFRFTFNGQCVLFLFFITNEQSFSTLIDVYPRLWTIDKNFTEAYFAKKALASGLCFECINVLLRVTRSLLTCAHNKHSRMTWALLKNSISSFLIVDPLAGGRAGGPLRDRSRICINPLESWHKVRWGVQSCSVFH